MKGNTLRRTTIPFILFGSDEEWNLREAESQEVFPRPVALCAGRVKASVCWCFERWCMKRCKLWTDWFRFIGFHFRSIFTGKQNSPWSVLTSVQTAVPSCVIDLWSAASLHPINTFRMIICAFSRCPELKRHLFWAIKPKRWSEAWPEGSRRVGDNSL